MSRIGRLPVAVPAGVTVEIAENNVVTVKGPKGTLTREFAPEMEIKKEGETIVVTRPNDLKSKSNTNPVMIFFPRIQQSAFHHLP